MDPYTFTAIIYIVVILAVLSLGLAAWASYLIQKAKGRLLLLEAARVSVARRLGDIELNSESHNDVHEIVNKEFGVIRVRLAVLEKLEDVKIAENWDPEAQYTYSWGPSGLAMDRVKQPVKKLAKKKIVKGKRK